MRITAFFVVSSYSSALFAAGIPANTLPTGGSVVSGQAAVTQNNATMQVNQSTQNAIINWQQFNIGSQANVRFNQPNSASATLNRVLSSNPSEILGSLSANGRLFLINPSGIIFGTGSRVDAGGFVASTLNMNDDDFMAARYRFHRNGATGRILNQGTLTAADGGFIALLAPEVRNEGIITARLGTVALVAGEKMTLNFSGEELVNVAVDPAAMNTLIENKHLVQADGGRVIMSASAAENLYSSVINTSGEVRAQGIENREGRIFLDSGTGGQTTVSSSAGTATQNTGTSSGTASGTTGSAGAGAPGTGSGSGSASNTGTGTQNPGTTGSTGTATQNTGTSGGTTGSAGTGAPGAGSGSGSASNTGTGTQNPGTTGSGSTGSAGMATQNTGTSGGTTGSAGTGAPGAGSGSGNSSNTGTGTQNAGTTGSGATGSTGTATQNTGTSGGTTGGTTGSTGTGAPGTGSGSGSASNTGTGTQNPGTTGSGAIGSTGTATQNTGTSSGTTGGTTGSTGTGTTSTGSGSGSATNTGTGTQNPGTTGSAGTATQITGTSGGTSGSAGTVTPSTGSGSGSASNTGTGTQNTGTTGSGATGSAGTATQGTGTSSGTTGSAGTATQNTGTSGGTTGSAGTGAPSTGSGSGTSSNTGTGTQNIGTTGSGATGSAGSSTQNSGTSGGTTGGTNGSAGTGTTSTGSSSGSSNNTVTGTQNTGTTSTGTNVGGIPANTLPTGGSVAYGQAAIKQNNASMQVNQSTQNAIINWQQFNIGTQANVRFNQPNSASATLNRVLSSDPTQILGSLSANGHLYLVSPSGIVFGAGSRVDAGSFVASTLNMSNNDFLAARNGFNGNGSSNTGTGNQNTGTSSGTIGSGAAGSTGTATQNTGTSGGTTGSAGTGTQGLGSGSGSSSNTGTGTQTPGTTGSGTTGSGTTGSAGTAIQNTGTSGGTTSSAGTGTQGLGSGIGSLNNTVTGTQNTGTTSSGATSSVVFGAGSRVDAGSLMASTLNINNDDFLSARNGFIGSGSNNTETGTQNKGTTGSGTTGSAGTATQIAGTSNGTPGSTGTSAQSMGSSSGNSISTGTGTQNKGTTGSGTTGSAGTATQITGTSNGTPGSTGTSAQSSGSVSGSSISTGTGTQNKGTTGSGTTSSTGTATQNTGTSIGTTGSAGTGTQRTGSVSGSSGGTAIVTQSTGSGSTGSGATSGAGSSTQNSGTSSGTASSPGTASWASGSASTSALSMGSSSGGSSNTGTGTQNTGGTSPGGILNLGMLSATNGGYIVLIAPVVSNEGVISTQKGTVVLAAGEKVTLNLSGKDLVNAAVDPASVNTSIDNKGLIQADGGRVIVSASTTNVNSSTINSSGEIRAQGVENRQGSITLDSGSGGQTTVSGKLDVSSADGKGGRIIATGERVLVKSGAQLTASGATGGGEVLVGGSWQGKDSAIRQATGTIIEKGAVLEANATVKGDGGTVVAWSDVKNPLSVTRAYGTFEAKGGPKGGDGGRIETSGHWLDVAGSQGGASAPKGKAGVWLFDPYNVTITGSEANGGWSGVNPNIWTPSSTGSTINAATINAKLNTGTSVTVTTNGGGTEIGDITVNSAITKSAGNSDVSLTLNAANSVVVNQAISNTGGSGKLHVTLDADNDGGIGDGAGIILLNADITTNGGNLSFGTGRTATIGGVSTLVGGDVYVAGSGARTLSTSGGNVDVKGEMIVANTSGLMVDSSGGTGGGNVHFYGLLNSGNTYAFTAGNSTWGVAQAAATSGTGGNIGDRYLATITSRLENAVAGRTANYNDSWLGGERKQNIGTDWTWRWVTGPEGLESSGNGRPFFTQTTNGFGGSAISGAYSNWNPLEPNGAGTGASVGEQYLQFTGSFGKWNDLSATHTAGIVGYVTETNLAASPVTVNSGSGTVTFSGAVGNSKALASLNVAGSTIAINGGAVTTEGSQTYDGNITLGSAATTLSQTNANTDFTLQTGRSITNATGTDATLTIQTPGSIIMNSGSSIGSAVGKLNTVLWANANGGGAGYISLPGTSASPISINTNGGGLWMGGGGGTASWTPYSGAAPLTVGNGYATGTASQSIGVFLRSSTISTNGGNIAIYGDSGAVAAAGGDFGQETDGIRFGGYPVGSVNGVTVNSGTGTILLNGRSRGTSGASSNYAFGVEFDAAGGITHSITSAATSGNAITVIGDASGAVANSFSAGISLLNNRTNLTATGGGGISLTGIGRNHLTDNQGILTNDSSTISSGSGNITLTADRLSLSSASRLTGTGSLTIQPDTAGTAIGISTGTGILSLPSSYFATNFTNGFSNITVGSATSGLITVGNTALSYNDALTLKTGSSIFLSTASSLTGNGNSLTLWSRAGGNDAATDSIGGSVWLPVGSSISTGGGAVTIGGGTNPASGYALGDTGATSTENNARYRGVTVNGTIAAGGGNISILGKGNPTYASRGVSIGGTVSTTSSGTITMAGIANLGSDGLALGDTAVGGGINGTVSTVNGNITLSGTKGTGSNGINLQTALSKITATGTGNVVMTSTGNINGTGYIVAGGTTDITAGTTGNISLTNTNNDFTGGVRIVSGNNVSITDTNDLILSDTSTVSGNLNVTTGTYISGSGSLNIGGVATLNTGSGSGTYSGVISGTGGLTKAGAGTLTLSGANTYTGATTIGAGTLALDATGTIAASSGVANSGMLSIGANKTIDSMTGSGGTSLGANTLTIGDGDNTSATYAGVISGTGGLTKAGAGTLTLSGANTYTGATTISAGTISVAAASGIGSGNVVLGGGTLEATGNVDLATRTVTVTADSTLSAANAKTISGGVFAASGHNLALTGGGNFTLDNTSNDFGTVTVTDGKNITLVDSNALTLNAVNSTGAIDIATLTGNLTLAGAITTTDATTNAITLNAGKNAATGTAAGGDIIVSGGSISIGVGGYATLYSGSVAGSAGLTNLIGEGSGRFRYNSDEAATNYATALSPGVNAIYREQPTVTVTANNDSKIYSGVAYSGGAGVTYSGFVNGDTSAGLGGTLAYGGSSQGAVNVQNYVISPSGLISGLGYALAYANGQLTVNPAALTVTAGNTAKTYGQTITFTGTEFTSTGLQNGETIGSVNLSSFGSAATANVAGSPYAITTSAAAGGSFNAGNYTITYNNGQLTINPAALTVTAGNAAKTYGQTITFNGTEFTSSGLQNGETIGSVSLTSGGAAATANVSGSPYAITAAAAAGGSFNASNYSISYNSGQLTINPAALTVTAGNAAKTYGQTINFNGNEFTSSGLQNGETIGSVSLTSGGAAATANVSGSPYAITPSAPAGGSFNAGNYTITYANGQLTINPAALTVTAGNATKTYGQIFTFNGTEFTSSGLQNGETIGSVSLSSSGSAATASLAGSPYAINASAAGGGSFNAGNYTITYNNGQLTVVPPTLSACAANPTAPGCTAVLPNPTTIATQTSFINTLIGAGGNLPPALPPMIKPPPQLLIEIVSEPVVPAIAAVSTFPPPETGSTTPALSETTVPAPPVTQETVAETPPVSGPPAGTPPSAIASGGPTESPATSGAPAGEGTTSEPGKPAPAEAPGAAGTTTASDGTAPAAAPTVAAASPAPSASDTGTPAAEPAPAPSPAATAAESFSPAALASGSIDAASLSGMSPAFQSVLSNALARGASPAEAVQRASNAAAESAAAERADSSPAASLASGSFATSSPLADSPTYQAALSSLLANGVSPAEAMQRAESATSESVAAARADSSPAALLASGSFATSPAASSPAYQAALSSLLARGVSPAAAMRRAESAAADNAAAARADNSPAASLASGSFALSSPAAASPAYQVTLSSLIAKGLSPAEAMRRAESAAAENAAGVEADAKNPMVGISSGNSAFLEKFSPTGDFSSSLGFALARGVPLETAMNKAMQANALEQQAIRADAASPLAGFSSGNSVFPRGNSDFDQALASAIGRGLTPAEAIGAARQAVARMPADIQTPSTALATGKNIDAALGTVGSSPTFDKALGNALARGMAVDAALAYAKRVEATTALRLPLPPDLAKQMPSTGSAVTVTTVQGKPLPGWIRYDAASRSFIVYDAPSGALPMEVAFIVNGKRTVLRISENMSGR